MASEFVGLITLVKNDLMGLNDEEIKIKKMAKKFGVDDPQYLQDAIDALSYLILHLAKLNASQDDFSGIYD